MIDDNYSCRSEEIIDVNQALPMTAELTAALKAHRHLNEWVFCDVAGERLSRGALDWILKANTKT